MTKPACGRLAWYELLTTDPKGAIAFYAEVVGWKTESFGPDYTMWVGGQGPLGGVTQLPEAAKQAGASSYWQAYIQVADVHETATLVQQLGGRVFVTEDVPTIGRLAVISDPQGAVIGMFKPARDMPPHDATQPGEFSWHELVTTAHEAAFAFYGRIAGWEQLGAFDMGPMGSYLLWGRDGKQLGGMMTRSPHMQPPDGRDVPPSWMYYVTIDDLDAAIGRATSAGGRVLNGPMEVPGGQRMVQLLDPHGAAFALVTPPTTP